MALTFLQWIACQEDCAKRVVEPVIELACILNGKIQPQWMCKELGYTAAVLRLECLSLFTQNIIARYLPVKHRYRWRHKKVLEAVALILECWAVYFILRHGVCGRLRSSLFSFPNRSDVNMNGFAMNRSQAFRCVFFLCPLNVLLIVKIERKGKQLISFGNFYHYI